MTHSNFTQSTTLDWSAKVAQLSGLEDRRLKQPANWHQLQQPNQFLINHSELLILINHYNFYPISYFL